MTNDDLTRRAIIAAHDAECTTNCGEDATTFRKLRTSERAIVELWRADLEAANSPQRLFGRLIATAKGREILDENGVHGVERADAAEAELLKMQEAARNTIGRAELAEMRRDKAEAEVQRLRTATGMADQAGADILDERNAAQAAIERAKTVLDGFVNEGWAAEIRAALDRERDPMTDDTLRDQVAKAVCSIAIGSERVETVMEIIHRHTAEQVKRAEAAEGQLDDIRQWCHDWSADQWAARAILDRIGWPETEATP